MISRIYGILAGAIYQRQRPERNVDYLRFIRRFPCVGCGATRRIEAMHIGPHGLGQKASDMDALPGCQECHQFGPDALHKIGLQQWTNLHRLDIPALQNLFRNLYAQKRRAA